MGDPVITWQQLGLHLADDEINVDRATLMISQAQKLCESIVGDLASVTGADVVVMRVAARAYVTTHSARRQQLAMSGSPFGTLPGADGGVFLTRQDKTDLRRMAGGGNAFTINPLPADYAPDLPDWDTDNYVAPTA